MSRRPIRALSTRACVFISRAFADGDSYKDTKSGNEKRRNGQAGVSVHVSKEFSKGGGGGGGGEGKKTNTFIWGRVQRFSLLQKNRNSQAVRVLILRHCVDRQSPHEGRELQRNFEW